jgi:PAS domain S-box-containing protein
MLTIEKLEPVFEDFPVAALLLAADERFRILEANNAYLDLLNRSREDLCGRPLFDVFPDLQPEDPESPIRRTGQSIRRSIELKEPQTPGTIPYPVDDGEGRTRMRFWVPEHIPVVDKQGSVTYVFQLIHELKENRAPIELPYQRVFETAQNPFFLSDEQGQVLAVNDAACLLFGFTKEESRRISRKDVLDYSDPRLHYLLLQREQTGRAKGEVTGICQGGIRFPCEYSSAQFLTDAGERRYCTEITDLRKLKAAEQHTKQSEENLQAIFNHTVEGFVLVNTALEIIASNDKADELIFQHAGEKKVSAGNSLLDYLPEDRRAYFKLAADRALGGEPIAYEKAYPAADGSMRWYCFSINPVQERESITGLCISGRDITSQKQAEEKLIDSEKRFRGLVENNTDAIAILSPEGKVLYVSPAGEQITGFTESEAMHLEALMNIHEEDLEKARDVMTTVLASPGVPVNAGAIRLLHKDGTLRWVEATLTNMLHDPAIGGIIDNFRDVTQRIEADLKLQDARQDIERSEEKYRKIFNISPLPKWVYDAETLRILEVNEAAVRHYGYTKAEFLSMTIMDIRPPEDKDALGNVLQLLTDDAYKSVNYWRHIKKNGDIIMVEITGHPIDFADRRARMVICRDVTEQMRAETNLIQSNERFRQAARAASDAIWDWDISTNMVWIGEGFITLFGYPGAGKPVPIDWMLEKLHPDDQSQVLLRIQAVLNGELTDRLLDEYRFEKADGSYAIISNNAMVIRNENDQPLRMIGAMKDVTHQKQEEHHLRLLESVVTNTTDAVMITAIGSNKGELPSIIYVNDAFSKMTGYTAEEIKVGGVALLHGPQTDRTQIGKLTKAMKNKESCAIEAMFYKKNGHPYWASLSISPVTNVDGEVRNYIAIERDITERMNYLMAIEEQNMQLREIAWSQSHIVRAPLARILGLTNMATDSNNEDLLQEILPFLKKSAEELDDVIREIVEKAKCIDLTDPPKLDD